jgi:hypothetical protein
MVVSGIGSGLKMGLKTLTEAVQIKQTRKYFALKSAHFYCYQHERAREAEKNIEIKQTKAIEINSNHPKEFCIIFKKKCYRLYCEHEQECQKWVNSLKAARDGGFSGGVDDPNDAYRYEKLKIYSRVTGKSMYKEYDAMLEAYEELMQE